MKFLYEGEEKRVQELIEIKMIEDCETKERRREFTVRTDRGEYYRITHGIVTTVEKVYI